MDGEKDGGEIEAATTEFARNPLPWSEALSMALFS
jgi:hypothetical protein